jgi:hypothetical protein
VARCTDRWLSHSRLRCRASSHHAAKIDDLAIRSVDGDRDRNSKFPVPSLRPAGAGPDSPGHP